MMGLILFLVFGLVVGLVARFLIPGRQPLSLVITMILGVAGSLFGGFVANALYGGSLFQLNTVGFIGSVIGSMVLLGGYILLTRNRGGRLTTTHK
jgi:uncharacterized membrane protein YeaQ/YmgE (transglycosylase-associated protein family)